MAVKSTTLIGFTGCLAVCVLVIGLSPADAVATGRLAEIRERGTLNCGVWPFVPGFASERDGRYAGFDIDICRAVAAAILGDAGKVAFVNVARVTDLADRDHVDLAVRRLTWTLNREMAYGMAFGPITYFDGQGFLVPKSSGINSALQLSDASICVMNLESHPEVLYHYFRDRGRAARVILVESDDEAEKALIRNRCRAYSADISWLAAARSRFLDGVTLYDILPELISKEPLAPLMRAEDTELLQLVRWTIFAMIGAEEVGISSANVDSIGLRSSRAQDFMSAQPERLQAIIAGVGNYGEVYERNLGTASAIQLDRGLNRLWSHGGLLYAPPLTE